MEQRLVAYAHPTSLTAEKWQTVRVRVLCLVRRTGPGSANTALLRLGALCAFLSTVQLDEDTPLASVLKVPAISVFLAARRDKVGARQLANISAMLERLRCTAHGLPYRAGNTADPATSSPRKRIRSRVTPSDANRKLIDQVCQPRPVLASIVKQHLTNHRLEHIEPHLPTADLSAHLGVLRGQPADSRREPVEVSSAQVWHAGPVSAQPQETEATQGKARR